MKLLSLELQGFKTFFNKTKLTFTDGISVVVGPNGSGKSNISDAIRWVLGETSTKLLRCSKMEDIIFNGTSSLKPRGIAEVSLTFDNLGRDLNYDSDQVCITRRYSRSGESEYMVNGKHVRLKDINELFMNTGVGRDGYSVIGQGLIDSIVSSRSEDRREIFEEAAGISKYRYRKSEAIAKLESAEQNLTRLNDIISGLEERIKPLSIQSEKAERYVEYSNELKGLELGIFSKSVKEISESIKKYDEDINILFTQKETEDKKLKDIEIQIEQSFKDNNKFLVEAELLRTSVQASEEQMVQKEKEISVLRNDVVHNEERVSLLNNDVVGLKDMYTSNLGNLKIKQSLHREKQSQISECEEQISLMNQNLNDILKKIEEQEGKSSKIVTTLLSMENELSQQRAKRTLIDSLIVQTKTNIQNIESSISESSISLSEFESQHIDDSSKFNEVSNKSEEISVEINKISLEIKKLESENRELDSKKKELVSFVDDKLRRAKILEDMEKNMEGFTQSVRNIMRESERGSLKGIHGPVSRLLSVDKKYSTAIDVALGMSAQNIVTSNENDTKKAIYYLKENRCGRATFMPISTIKGSVLDSKELQNLQGFVSIAKDICKYNNEYEGILSYLLGRVVIVDNLDNALNIAKKFSYRFKIVTLDGQTINSGGSLTGGSISNKQGFLSRDSEIKLLRKEAEEYKLDVGNVDEKLVDIRNKQDTLKKKHSEFTEQFYLLRESKSALQTKLEISITNIDSCKKKIEALQNKYSEQNGELGKLSQDLSSTDELINKLSKELEILKLSETGTTDEKDKYIVEREKLNAIIQEYRLKLMSYVGELKIIDSEINYIQSEQINIENKIESNNKDILSLSNQNVLVNEQIKIFENEIKSIREKIDISRTKISDFNKLRMEIERTSINLRQDEKRHSNIVNELVSKLTLLESKKDGLEKRAREISDKLWQEYGLTVRESEKYEIHVVDMKESKNRLVLLKSKIKELGVVNLDAIEEYRKVKDKYDFMREQIRDIEKSSSDLNKIISSLTEKMQTIFSEKFKEINKNFSIMFCKLFGGGSAELAISNPNDILSSGIDISVNPPGKVVSRLELLSGGEKALVAISLYFAIMKVNPPPFCVLDEIEASLDDVNVERFASYLRESSEKTQFIVVSHRRGTMEEADVLYGVTMQDEGISKVLRLNVSDYEGVS